MAEPSPCFPRLVYQYPGSLRALFVIIAVPDMSNVALLPPSGVTEYRQPGDSIKNFSENAIHDKHS
jgi:hypothetical protein